MVTEKEEKDKESYLYREQRRLRQDIQNMESPVGSSSNGGYSSIPDGLLEIENLERISMELAEFQQRQCQEALLKPKLLGLLNGGDAVILDHVTNLAHEMETPRSEIDSVVKITLLREILKRCITSRRHQWRGESGSVFSTVAAKRVLDILADM